MSEAEFRDESEELVRLREVYHAALELETDLDPADRGLPGVLRSIGKVAALHEAVQRARRMYEARASEPPRAPVQDPRECLHFIFEARFNVARLEDVGEFRADVAVQCADCGTPFRFEGLPHGYLNGRPTRNVTGLEASMPIAPGPLCDLPTGITYEVGSPPNRGEH